MEKLVLLIFGFLISTLGVQEPSETKIEHKKIEQYTNEIFDSLVDIRRDLHKHPELSGQEKRTSKIVADYLSSLGLEVVTGVGGHGVVGILKGDKEGRNIAWRADMDAVPSNASDPVAFKSENQGVRHICGHDVHTTIGLGIANVLSKQKRHLEGTIYFVFQPAEEKFEGAKAMIADGLFELITPEEMYGIHLGPDEAGTLNTKGQELFAYQKTLEVKLKPNTNEEEIKRFLTEVLNGYVRFAPNSTPWSLDFLSDAKQGLENKETIYKDYFFLQHTTVSKNDDYISFYAHFFETDKERTEAIIPSIKAKITNSEFKDSLISIGYASGNPIYNKPTVLNDSELAENALQTIDRLYNNSLIKPIYGQVPYFNEDFIYYQQKVPGVLLLLGASNTEKDMLAMPHSPDFVVDEETIKYGVKYAASLLVERASEVK